MGLALWFLVMLPALGSLFRPHLRIIRPHYCAYLTQDFAGIKKKRYFCSLMFVAAAAFSEPSRPPQP